MRPAIAHNRHILLCGLFLFFAGQVSSQISDFGSVLKKTIDSPSPGVFYSFSPGTVSKDYKLPLLEKLELRPLTDRMTLARQQFSLRASFNTLKQRRSLIDKQKAFLGIQDEEALSLRREGIYEVYKRYLRLARLHSEEVFLQNDLSLAEKQHNVTEQILASGRPADLSDYLELKAAILSLKADIQDKRIHTRDLSGLLLGDTMAAVRPVSLRPDEVKNLITDLNIDTASLFETRIKQAQLQYLDASYGAEKANAAKIFDFIQARYTVREDLIPENRFSLGFGLMFPYKGSTKLELADILTRKKIAERDIAVISRKTVEEFKLAKLEFFRKMAMYEQLRTIPADPNYLTLRAKILESGKLDPVSQQKMVREELSIDKKTNTAFFDALDLYLRLLHLSGKLYEEPVRNYLESGFPLIF